MSPRMGSLQAKPSPTQQLAWFNQSVASVLHVTNFGYAVQLPLAVYNHTHNLCANPKNRGTLSTAVLDVVP
jgi:hypothetical protein